MADVFSKRRRSEIMSSIRGRGNAATELRFVDSLRANKIKGWRRGYPLFGKPDVVFPAERLCIFVDGCFWHGCSVHWSSPSTNAVFWITKVNRNRERDRVVRRELTNRGWKVMRIWQHELRNRDAVIRRVRRALVSARGLTNGD